MQFQIHAYIGNNSGEFHPFPPMGKFYTDPQSLTLFNTLDKPNDCLSATLTLYKMQLGINVIKGLMHFQIHTHIGNNSGE